MSQRFVCPALLAFFATFLTGCGGDEFGTAPVRGTLSCGGQPVTTGTVSFSPIAPDGGGLPGKSASGKVQPDGTFILTTYEVEDGAVIGRHIVSWAPPERGSEDADEEGGVPALPPPPAGRGTKVPCPFGGQAEVEVVDGDNDLKVELTPRRLERENDD